MGKKRVSKGESSKKPFLKGINVRNAKGGMRIKTIKSSNNFQIRCLKDKDVIEAKAYEKQQKEIQKIEEYILKYKTGIKSKSI